MNILMISELYNYGGATGVMNNLANELKCLGHNPILLYGYNYNNYEIEKGQYVIFNNKYIRKISNRMRMLVEKYNLSNIYAFFYVKRIIKQKNIDILHFNAMQGGFLSIRDIECLCKRYQVVWTLHDTWLLTGGCMCYWDCEEWKQECIEYCNDSNFQMKYRNAKVNLNRKKKALRDKKIFFVAPSQWMYNNAKASFIKKERITRIENGINIDLFYPLKNKENLRVQWGINTDKKILMFMAGSIDDKFKGWHYLESALKMIKNLDTYEVIVVGGGAKKVDEFGAEIKTIDFVQKKESLNELYNIADVLVLPSVQDNFPTVSLEAMAAGTPVVAFRVGGISEQINEDVGWIVPEISAKCLAETIDRIFSKPNFQEEISYKGMKARKRCEELYSSKLMTEKYTDIFYNLLKNVQ